ncbi:MAG: CxxC-x17-CxxC domain-containing protein [Candidatus Kariarchaeaceae archaeon]
MSYRRDQPREMHPATCAECQKETEVPFKPDGERPVYCQDCYRARRPSRY